MDAKGCQWFFQSDVPLSLPLCTLFDDVTQGTFGQHIILPPKMCLFIPELHVFCV